MKKMVVCGCSFAKGIGCKDLNTKPFGTLLSDKLDSQLINLAKGSSSNFSIYLQTKYALEKVNDIDLLIFSTTSYDRTEWFNSENKNEKPNLTNTDVNYHQYPPHGKESYHQILPFFMEDDENYNGSLFTENFMGIIDYVDRFVLGDEDKIGYYERFDTESDKKMKILYDYFFNIFDTRIQRIYDLGIFMLSHTLLDTKSVRHVFLTDDIELQNILPKQNWVDVSWSGLSQEYPDTIPSLHTSEVGHKIVSDRIYDKLIDNNWVKND
jgi:hypothetical protein